MTPAQKIKHMILAKRATWTGEPMAEATAGNVDQMYCEAVENDDGKLQDARNEVRYSGIETGIACPPSRHYESDAVAAQALDGSWVGWTYWHGGGKHSEPEAIDWISDAYALECAEEQKLVTVRTFTRPTA